VCGKKRNFIHRKCDADAPQSCTVRRRAAEQLYTHTKIFFFFFSFIIFILFFLDREKRRKDERMNGTRREVLDDDAIKKRDGWRESQLLDTSESLQQTYIHTEKERETEREI
jgi:hypothetical protein